MLAAYHNELIRSPGHTSISITNIINIILISTRLCLTFYCVFLCVQIKLFHCHCHSLSLSLCVQFKIMLYIIIIYINQGWGQVQLTKYSSTPSTPNIYQVQVLVKYSFFKKVLKYIKYFHIKYKYKYKYSC